MKHVIITNNPKVYDEFLSEDDHLPGAIKVDFHDEMLQEEILRKARDMIHLGARLVVHPMMGRIKPHETPYKSVFLDVPDEKELNIGGPETDFMSVTIIEDSISETNKLLNNTYKRKYDETILEDLRYLDYLLMKSAVEETGR